MHHVSAQSSAPEPGNSQKREPDELPRDALEKTEIMSVGLPRKLKYIEPQARIILANILHFFQTEAEIQGFLVNPRHAQLRTTAATGVKRKAICSLKKESRTNPNGDKFTIKPKRRTIKKGEVTYPELYDMERLRGFLFDFILNAEHVTSGTALQAIQKVGLYNGSRTSFPRLLNKMGFSFKRTRVFLPKFKSTLTEDHHVRFARFSFLRRLLNFKNDGKPIVYVSAVMLPSLRIGVCPGPVKVNWSDQDWKGVIGLAGDEKCMLDDGFSFWRCSREPGNYFFNYNACCENYVAWIVDRVLPSCPDKAVIVLDHDPKYFDKIVDPPPAQLSSKNDMKSWLSRNSVSHDENVAKVELYELIRQIGKTLVKASVKSTIEQKGFEVLPLPPYHWELNPATSIAREIRSMVIDQKSYKFSDVAEFVKSQVLARNDRWTDYSSKCWALSEEYLALHPKLEERQEFLAKKGIILVDPDDDHSDSEGEWLPQGDDEGGRSDEDSHEVKPEPAKAKKASKRVFLVGDDVT